MNGMVLCRVHPSERFLHVQYLNFTLSRSVMLSQAKSGDQWRQRSSNCRQCKPTPRFICLISWILKCTSAIKMPRPLILPLPLFLLLFSFTLKHTLSARLWDGEQWKPHKKIATLSKIVPHMYTEDRYINNYLKINKIIKYVKTSK